MVFPLPGLDVPVVDLKIGKMTQVWYTYFQSLEVGGAAAAAGSIFALASEYGAVGDNTADDTTALQDMIDDVSANGKIGVLVGSAGNDFKITDPLVAPSSTVLRGLGRDRSTIYPTGAEAGIVAAGNTSPSTRTFYWDFADFSIRYPDYGSGGNAFDLQNVSHARIVNCNVVYADVAFWLSEDSYYNYVEHCRIDTCRYGMYCNYIATKGSNQNTFFAVHVAGIQSNGFGVIDYSNMNNWISCSFEGSDGDGVGVRLQDSCNSSTVQSCRFENLDEGIRVVAGAVDCVVAFNMFTGIGGGNIFIDAGTDTHYFGQDT
jgi:hypothetical protein